MAEPYFCFVSYTDIEQNEPGDTIIHTFSWSGWVHCNIRYYYFWATIAGATSKSTSPWFELHYTDALSPPTIFPCFYSGSIWRDGAPGDSYLAVRNAFTGFTSNIPMIFQAYLPWDNSFELGRAFLMFNTAALAPGTHIKAARIRFYAWSLNTWVPWYLYLLDGSSVHTPAIPEDYHILVFSEEPFALIFTSYLTVPGWNYLNIAPEYFGTIKPGGTTKYGLRSLRDIQAISPKTNGILRQEYLEIAGHTSPFPPSLQIATL